MFFLSVKKYISFCFFPGTNMDSLQNEKHALCGVCPAGCWVKAGFDRAGKLCSVRPDESSEFGILCKLGEHSADIVYSPDRLLHPMRRRGARGTYDFERITWDTAYDIIAEKLQSVKEDRGAEAAAIYTGRGGFELSLCDVFQPKGVAVSSASSVLFPYGSPNTLGVGSLCYVSFAMIAPHVTCGGMLIDMFSDIENAGLIVVWGANPATDSPPLDFNRIIKAQARGAQVIVIDPRRTRTAKLPGAQWIAVRSGTDGALALGICNVLMAEELYDEAFVRDWTEGFGEFARYVQHFTPETVESITEVSADTVRMLARRIAGAEGASPVMYSGLEYSESGVQAIRAVLTLWALAGQLDVPGGRCFTMRENVFPVNRGGLIANPDRKRSLGRDRFPVYSLYRDESHPLALPDAVLHGKPYPVKALILLGSSIITAWPQPGLWRRTLQALDFLVCIDRQRTADMAYADIVLPATTLYEIESYMTYGPLFRLRERVIEPLGEARNDFLIMAGLASRLGYGHLYPQSEEELLRHVLKGSGFTLEDVRAAGGVVQAPAAMMEYKKWEKGRLRTDGKPGFNTPTGKFEIRSTILEEHGYDPLPLYTEPRESPRSLPGLTEQFPLVFNSGSRVTTDFRSQHHGVAALCRERPEPAVTINTADAEVRNIRDGDRVRIRSLRGQVVMRALVTDDIMQGTIDANMGGGGPVGPQAWQECNINELTDGSQYDPISGFPVYKALLCDVQKISESADTLVMDSGENMRHSTGASPVFAAVKAPRRIYLDHNATTPPAPEVVQVMTEHLERRYGNPSSIGEEGRQAKAAIDEARRSVAQLLNCTARRLIFTGGGSESNNMVLKGAAFAAGKGRNHIITSRVEHPSVLSACGWLEQQGFFVTYLNVDSSGRVSPAELARHITDRTCLVSIMFANNETGTQQPVRELAAAAHARGVPFHTDAVQAAGKVPVDTEALGVDFLTLSGHKIYGPKGIGVVYARKGASLEPLIHGGKQEGGLRAGTENTPAIAGLGAAARLALRNLPVMEKVRILRDRLEQGIRAIVPGARVNGAAEDRLPNTTSLTLPGIRGESLVLALDQKGVSLSSGSACRSGSPKPSHVLLACGLSEQEAHCSIRMSLGTGTTDEEIVRTVSLFDQILRTSKSGICFVPCR